MRQVSVSSVPSLVHDWHAGAFHARRVCQSPGEKFRHEVKFRGRLDDHLHLVGTPEHSVYFEENLTMALYGGNAHTHME